MADARTLLHVTLRQHGVQMERDARADSVGDAALMVSELVTNAVRHARGLLLLEITIEGDTLFVAVVDDAPDSPALRNQDHGATGGRGLTIVDALADRWGFTPGAHRKAVWFELALH